MSEEVKIFELDYDGQDLDEDALNRVIRGLRDRQLVKFVAFEIKNQVILGFPSLNIPTKKHIDDVNAIWDKFGKEAARFMGAGTFMRINEERLEIDYESDTCEGASLNPEPSGDKDKEKICTTLRVAVDRLYEMNSESP
jgi:hypothetical protein